MDNAKDKRILLSEVIVSESDPVTTRVSLKLNEQIAWGESTGEKKTELTLIGQATLEALNKLLPRPLDAKLDYVEAVAAQRDNTPQIALSLIRFRELQKELFLNGSCPIGDSPYQAAAKSVLDALNRKIDVELQRAALRARTGALVATSDMMSMISPDTSSQSTQLTQNNYLSNSPSESGNSIDVTPKVTKSKESSVVEDALNLERAANLSTQAYSSSMKGNYEQSAFYYQQAIELEENNARYHYELGLVLSKLPDKKREARIALKRAVELNPSEATYTKELEYFDRGDQLAKLPTTTENIKVPGLPKDNDEDQTGMRKPVSNKVVGAAIAVILLIALTPIAIFFFNTEFAGGGDEIINPELPPALKLAYGWPSIESGKTLKQKTNEIVTKDNKNLISDDFWSTNTDKAGNTTVSFFYPGKNVKIEATWTVDVAKKVVLPTNPGAESLSGKVQ